MYTTCIPYSWGLPSTDWNALDCVEPVVDSLKEIMPHNACLKLRFSPKRKVPKSDRLKASYDEVRVTN